jgi:tRNA 2-thiouridine synthesizing protein A
MQSSEQSPLIVDVRGHRCPAPSLRLRRALERAAAGTRLQLLADDAMARIDVPHLLGQTGDRLISVSEEGKTLVFTVEKCA